MVKYYCTFGSGQPHAGKVLPIIAKSESQVRDYMYAVYGGKWCGTYSEESWLTWKAKAQSMGWPVEQELETITLYLGEDVK